MEFKVVVLNRPTKGAIAGFVEHTFHSFVSAESEEMLKQFGVSSNEI